jgi:hypothetical protein
MANDWNWSRTVVIDVLFLLMWPPSWINSYALYILILFAPPPPLVITHLDVMGRTSIVDGTPACCMVGLGSNHGLQLGLDSPLYLTNESEEPSKVSFNNPPSSLLFSTSIVTIMDFLTVSKEDFCINGG